VGYFDKYDFFHPFFSDAVQRPVVLLMEKKRSVTNVLHVVKPGDAQVVDPVNLVDVVGPNTLVFRCEMFDTKPWSVSPFLHVPRPTTFEGLVADIQRKGYGILKHERSSEYAAPALKALHGDAYVHGQGKPLPRDCTHVVVTVQGEHLEKTVDPYFDLILLTFREECERRAAKGEIAERGVVTFTTGERVHASFVRKDLINDLTNWAGAITREELDKRRDIKDVEGRLKCDLSRMKQLWLAGIKVCRVSGVIVFDPDIESEEYQDKVRSWEALTEELHKLSNEHHKRPGDPSDPSARAAKTIRR